MSNQEDEVIVVTCDQVGQVVIQTSGFEGPACLEAVKSLKASLGEVTEEIPTAEMKKIPTATATTKAKSSVTQRKK